MSTGSVPQEHEIIDTVFVLHHTAQPAFGTIKITEVMAAATEDLKAAAQQMGAHGVIWAHFQVVASTIAVTDVLAYGTAVRLLSR